MFICYVHNWQSFEYSCPACEMVTTIPPISQLIINQTVAQEVEDTELSQDNIWCDIRDEFIKNENALQDLPKHFIITKKNKP